MSTNEDLGHTHNTEGDFICHLCDKRFLRDRKYNFERHVETCKKNAAKKFKCEQCHVARCKTKKLLKYHMRHHCTKRSPKTIVLSIEPNIGQTKEQTFAKFEQLTVQTARDEISSDTIDSNEVPAHYVDVQTTLETDGNSANASDVGVILEANDQIPPGFVNPGTNTCYLNSILQSLFHNRMFVEWILGYEKEHAKSCPHSCESIIFPLVDMNF